MLGVAVLGWVAIAFGGISLLRYAVGLPMLVRYLRRARVRAIPKGPTPALTLLKPVYGAEEGLEENLVATLRQNYPEFEVLFLHEREDDPALEVVRAAREQVPDVDVRTIAGCAADATNPKVSVLIRGEDEAQHDIVVAADSDVRPDPLYLRDVANALQEADAVSFLPVMFGMRGFWARGLALVVDTDAFLAGVMARGRFTTGATIGVRREALRAAGGFRAVGNHIADDYQIGQELKAAGRRLALARRAARVYAPEGGLAWCLRWLRTVRAAVPVAYLIALVFGTAPLLCLLAALLSPHAAVAWTLLGLITAGRVALAVAVDLRFCWDRSLIRSLWLLPLLWVLEPLIVALGLFGNGVTWRGRRYRIDRGRVTFVGSP